jgi:hypothetical protein
MKNFPFILKAVIIISLLFSACKTGMENQIVGKWKIDEMHIQYYQQQQENGESQMKMLQDSMSKTTDTAKVHTYQSQIQQIQDQMQAFTSNRDSALKNNSWEFQEEGKFIATEAEGPRDGLWSYDEKLGMLFTVIDKQTSSVKVKFTKDTMILQLDSVNYMKFTPIKK